MTTMLTPFDWTPIFGIEFHFASASSNPTAATSLNKAYSEIIGKDELLSEFFVTRKDVEEEEEEEEEGPLEIALDPQLHILNCIAKAIAINLIDPDEVTKGHISNLLSKCVIKHVRNNGSTKRMRYKTEFDTAAKHAIRTTHPPNNSNSRYLHTEVTDGNDVAGIPSLYQEGRGLQVSN
eukprot:jgi/Psemu1/8133/gm1.8133_g